MLLTAEGDTTEQRDAIVDLSEPNFAQVSASQKRILLAILGTFKEFFPSDPKRVPPCNTGKLGLPFKNENCTPVTVG